MLVSILVVSVVVSFSGMRSFVKCDGFLEDGAAFLGAAFFVTGELVFAVTVFFDVAGDAFVFLGAAFLEGVFFVPVDDFFAVVFFLGSAIGERNEIIHQRYSSLGLFKAHDPKI